MLNDEKLKEQADQFIAYAMRKEIQRLAEEYKPMWFKNSKLHKSYANKNAQERHDKPNSKEAMQ